MKSQLSSLVVLALSPLAANAAVIVDTLPANNQANLTADAGQTFTTSALGAENALSTIEIEGPQAGATGTAFTLELWTDVDGDHSTWGTGVLLGTSDAQVFSNNAIATFTFASQPVLSDSTVYAFTYTDGSGTRILARMGLTNASAIADGTLFGGGTQQFGDAFDTAMRINTVASIPEPSSIFLSGLGALALLMRRRR